MTDPELKEILLSIESKLQTLIDFYDEPLCDEELEELAFEVYKKLCEELKVNSIKFMGIA
tara:strand:- start:892 stop:1071 length:180 start_codon:yes stop_codon:yes gene_type:complete